MKKWNKKSSTPPPFKKTCPCTILPPPFFDFSDSPLLGKVIQIYWNLNLDLNEWVISIILDQIYCICYFELDEWRIIVYFEYCKDTEFLIEGFKLNNFFLSWRKKRILAKICSTVVVWYVVITSCNCLLTHWNQSKYVIRGFIINYFEHATETLIPSSRFKWF